MANVSSFTGTEGFKARCPISQIKRILFSTDGAAHVAGDVVAISSGITGVVMESASTTQDYMIAYDIPMIEMKAKNTEAFVAGHLLYWDGTTNKQLTATSTNLAAIAIALEDKASTTATATVHWLGYISPVTAIDITY
jgi:predicted RecA/RadA family phage recombinase